MNLKVQKRLASQILNCSPDRVVFDNDRLDDIKQAITKRDLKLLIGDKAITKKAGNFTSRVRANKLATQKRKGRRAGPGSKKGKATARANPKQIWMHTIRIQRAFVLLLLEKKIITRAAYRELYLKSKGGYFRSRRHIKLYLQEHEDLLLDKEAIKKVALENETAKKPRKIINNKKTAEKEE
jgi:large subunit ribosomal protein L19e